MRWLVCRRPRLLRAAGVLSAALALASDGVRPAWAQAGRLPFAVADAVDPIAVVQRGGALRFWFPVETRSLSVRPENEPVPIWQIEARSPFSATPVITYGSVPPGFVQRRPSPGIAAPGLETGRTYVVTGATRPLAGAVFTYEGSAASYATPEATVATFYAGIRSGDKELSESTFFAAGTMDARAFRAGLITAFQIVVVAPAQLDHAFARPGDVEVLVDVEYPTLPQPVRMGFLLRRDGTDWKIVAHSAENGEL